MHLTSELTRFYPNPDFARTVLGRPAAPGRPASGIERVLDTLLAGQSGSAVVLRDQFGRRPTAAAPKAAPTAAPRPKRAVIDAEAFVSLGGWYSEDFSILFQPTGHADPFIKAWLDYTASTYGTPGQAVAEHVFHQLADKDARGRCAKCHSIEKGPGERLSVMWQPKTTEEAGGVFTHFMHKPHLEPRTELRCSTCHQFDPAATYQKSFETTDPYRVASNFKPILREVCSTCHKQRNAGEACVQCHNYHAAPITTPAEVVRATKHKRADTK